MAAREGTGVDMLVGIGGTPEAVIAACALKCLDGAMYGRLWPRDDKEREAALDAGYDLEKVLDIDDLVRGDTVFFAATGVTDGELLRGVRFDRRGSLTQSPSMRSKSAPPARSTPATSRLQAESVRLHRLRLAAAAPSPRGPGCRGGPGRRGWRTAPRRR